jgi:hypothetical protein
MLDKLIALMFLLLCSVGFAQRTPETSSAKEAANRLESQPPAMPTQPAESTKPGSNNPPVKRLQNGRAADPVLGTITSSALNRRVMPATALSNEELLTRGKTIYVVSHSFFVKKEQLERGLVNRKELVDWGFHVVDDEKHADFILNVKRAPFQNNFPFTLTDRASGIVLFGGTVNSLFGTVPGKIAGQIANKLKDVYKMPPVPKP